MKHFLASPSQELRTLYTAVIRPTITYNCGIWAGGEKGEGLQERTLRPLAKLQNKCLRRITGAAAPTSVHRRPHLKKTPTYHRPNCTPKPRRYALDTDQSTAEVAIRQRCGQIGYQDRPSRRRQQQAKTTPREALSVRARKARAEEAREENQQEERQQADGQVVGQTGRGKISDRLESW